VEERTGIKDIYIAFNLLLSTFTMKEVQERYEAIADKAYDLAAGLGA
jgi:hypothetical protein